ncbi:DUF6597 domain-containing transcriptional factor [Aliikangiella sp. IMCC44359]|uniref:DUF6597 domain-containing transcriptional factor n=1 Tax=Aliikangiella sp. IMCC44359 TaxID=3459125 RepID=UPI00403AA035
MKPLTHLGFRSFVPHVALRPYVQCYWHIQVNSHANSLPPEYMHPEGGSGIIFNLKAPIKLDDQLVKQNAVITGPTRQTNQLQLTGITETIGIRFHPGGGHKILSVPLYELLDTNININQLSLSPLNNTITEQLYHLNSIDDRVSLLDKVLLSLLKDSPLTNKRLHSALNWIRKHHGQKPVSLLSDILNLSQRQLDRHFKCHLGLLPKQYSQIQQVEYSRSLLKQAPLAQSLTEIGACAGFYDQAHFIRQFRQVVGITPGDYRSKARIITS